MREIYNADAELTQALVALKEARYRLSRASFALEQDALKCADAQMAIVLGEYSGSLNALANTVSNIATGSRQFRKAVRTVKGGAA